MSQCLSTFPAFAEAFCSTCGRLVEAISEIKPPDFCATQESALRVSHFRELDGTGSAHRHKSPLSGKNRRTTASRCPTHCATLRGRGLLDARVLFKDLAKLALTLANDLQKLSC
jgi:hypothetical protein